jgi:inorganic phosphate transporter, PiT family
MELELIVFGVALALLFDFANGMHDSANSIATIVATRVLKPFQAVAWAAFWNFAAIIIMDLRVARSIGKGVVDPDVVTTGVILAGLVGAIIWSLATIYVGLPISSSHALVGGLLGAGLVCAGPTAIFWNGVGKIAIFMVVAPLIGVILAYFNMWVVTLIFHKMDRRKTEKLFRRLQLVSAALFSLGHGTGDAQKTMGIIAILLLTGGIASDPNGNWLLRSTFDHSGFVPNWVALAAFTAIALGTLMGGWKIVRTMGVRLTSLGPREGFCAETAAAASILGTAYFGIPVSTTHTISGGIMGVGAMRRLTAVRWGVMGRIVWAWILTIPISAGIAALTYKAMVLIAGDILK